MAEEALGCKLRVDGDIGLLERPRRALLVSRGERSPTPGDPCIRATLDATRKVIGADETLVVGTFRFPWDLALWTCKNARASAVIALEEMGVPYGILPEKTLCVWPEKQAPALRKEERQQQRDRLAGLLATCAYSIHVRSGGNMARVRDELSARSCPVETWPGEYSTASHPQSNKTSIEIQAAGHAISFADRLTHFTRAPDALWPSESYAEYLHWLASGPAYVSRDAFQALRRIVAAKKIHAHGRLINSSVPMVCLTQRNPAELLEENHWRKGLLRWTYSHYALSFMLDDLAALGARPVQYVPGDTIKDYPASERCLLQTESSAGIDWRSEAEWRIRGDLDFSHIDPARLVALVANADEALSMEREFRVRVVVMPQVKSK